MKRELDQDADQSVTAISKRVASDRPKPGLLDLPHKVLTKIAYYVCEWKPRLLTVSRTFNEVFPATVWYSFEQEDWQIRRRITASAWSHYGHFVRRALISLESDWYLPANMIPNVVYLEVMLQRLEDVFGPNSGNKLAHLRHVKITSAIKGRLYKKHAKMVARFANAAAKRPHPVKFEYDLSVRSNEELIAMTELAHAIVDTSHHKFTIVIGRAYPHPPKGMAKLAAMMYEIRVIGLDTLNGLLGYHDCTFPNLHILYLWGEKYISLLDTHDFTSLKPERFPILRRLKVSDEYAASAMIRRILADNIWVSISELMIHDAIGSAILESFNHQLPNVTNLTLQNFECPIDACMLASQFPQLQHLVFRFYSTELVLISVEPARVQFPQLKELSFNTQNFKIEPPVCKPEYLKFAMECAPNLEQIHLMDCRVTSEIMKLFEGQTHESVRKITTTSAKIEHLCNILQLFPKTESVSVYGYTSDSYKTLQQQYPNVTFL